MSDYDFQGAHKKAFRVAFDLLNELWPPENTAEYFTEKAYPRCAEAWDEFNATNNPLGMEFVKCVYWYLADTARRMG